MKFIAEIGLNHNGNIDLACELIRVAKLSGADVVKFQLGWRDKPGEINCLNDESIKKIISFAEYNEIELLFSVISWDAWRLIEKYDVGTVKIASRTFKYDYDLAAEIVKSKKDVIASLGMWDKNEKPFPEYENIQYLWCVSEYPTYPEKLIGMPRSFKESGYAGYSDHSLGVDASIIAIARGAEIIEKHFTLDKMNSTIRDHLCSATPAEFRQMVDLGRQINKKIKLGV
jgi:sialic acid synthase SpsE